MGGSHHRKLVGRDRKARQFVSRKAHKFKGGALRSCSSTFQHYECDCGKGDQTVHNAPPLEVDIPVLQFRVELSPMLLLRSRERVSAVSAGKTRPSSRVPHAKI